MAIRKLSQPLHTTFLFHTELKYAIKTSRMTEVKCGKKTNNPFFNFLRCYRTQPENTHKSAAELAVQGACKWNKMDDMQRKPFVEMAVPFLKPKKPRTSRARSTTRRTTTRRRTYRSTTRRRTRRSPTRRARRSTTRRTRKSVGRRRTTSRRRTVKRRTSRRRTSRRRAYSGSKNPVKSSRGRGRPRKSMACAKPYAMKLQSEQAAGSTTGLPYMQQSPLHKTTESPLQQSPETPLPTERCQFESASQSEIKAEEHRQNDCGSCTDLTQNVLVDSIERRQGCSLVDNMELTRCQRCPRTESSDECDFAEITINRKCAEMQKKFKQ